eukprot:847342-Pyramimonas_sp.AAC.1
MCVSVCAGKGSQKERLWTTHGNARGRRQRLEEPQAKRLGTKPISLCSFFTRARAGGVVSLGANLAGLHSPRQTRARHGHYTLIKPLHHWRIQFSPQCFTEKRRKSAPELRAVR